MENITIDGEGVVVNTATIGGDYTVYNNSFFLILNLRPDNKDDFKELKQTAHNLSETSKSLAKAIEDIAEASKNNSEANLKYAKLLEKYENLLDKVINKI